ncbi:MAG: hypothetical protein J3Q66DRAFT_389356 [Benniella sp.]|nr:MAG: hypothetical protein J3Q66DRAFT_389356 [Benniella sp.]
MLWANPGVFFKRWVCPILLTQGGKHPLQGRITFFGSYGAKTFSTVDAKDGVTIVVLTRKRKDANHDHRLLCVGLLGAAANIGQDKVLKNKLIKKDGERLVREIQGHFRRVLVLEPWQALPATTHPRYTRYFLKGNVLASMACKEGGT